jgi:hypothetical protein
MKASLLGSLRGAASAFQFNVAATQLAADAMSYASWRTVSPKLRPHEQAMTSQLLGAAWLLVSTPAVLAAGYALGGVGGARVMGKAGGRMLSLSEDMGRRWYRERLVASDRA